MTPNIEDVLALLPILQGQGWVMDHSGALYDREGRCALCSLAHEVDPTFYPRVDAFAAAESLGISHNTCKSLAHANDWYKHARRAQLEVALGVKKPSDPNGFFYWANS